MFIYISLLVIVSLFIITIKSIYQMFIYISFFDIVRLFILFNLYFLILLGCLCTCHLLILLFVYYCCCNILLNFKPLAEVFLQFLFFVNYFAVSYKLFKVNLIFKIKINLLQSVLR